MCRADANAGADGQVFLLASRRAKRLTLLHSFLASLADAKPMTHALRKLPNRSDAPVGVLRAGTCVIVGRIDCVTAVLSMHSHALRMHTGVNAAH